MACCCGTVSCAGMLCRIVAWGDGVFLGRWGVVEVGRLLM